MLCIGIYSLEDTGCQLTLGPAAAPSGTSTAACHVWNVCVAGEPVTIKLEVFYDA
jgi:hypothetical protein